MPADLTHPVAIALRAAALTYPQAYEDFPWGDRVCKVKGKIFLFVSERDGKLAMGAKLPLSNAFALMLAGTQPTGYGLGKAGWVSATFEAVDEPPVELLLSWIRESYCAVAPKGLSKALVVLALTGICLVL